MNGEFRHRSDVTKRSKAVNGNQTAKKDVFAWSHKQAVPVPSSSAVIVNFNGGERVLKCLDALYRQAVPLEEVIVVDNNSTDGSPARIRTNFPSVRVLELHENHGPAVARNAGLQQARTDLVLLIDNDLYVTEHCLTHMLQAYQKYNPTVICPRILLMPECEIVQADGAAPHFIGTMLLRHGRFHIKDAPVEAGPVGACPSGCILVHRESVLGLGGFDEMYFFYFEDLEFSIRLRASGHQIVCEPAAVVYHERGSGIRGLSFRGHGPYPPFRLYLTMRHRLLTMLVHYRIRTMLALCPALMLYELATLIMVTLRGWGSQWVRAWIWQFLNAKRIWRRRRRAQRARSVKDSDILVGGMLPLAPGFVRSRTAERAIAVLSTAVNLYWQIARRWIG